MENLPRAVRPEGGSSPRPTQLRIEGRTGIVVPFSEEISRDELEAALAASGIKVTRPANRNKADIPLTLAPALQRGPKARREWVLTLGEEPVAGEQVELLLDKWSVMDGFLNHPEEDLHFATTWPATSASSRHILEDTDPPRVDLVVALDGHLEIELSEAPDEATLASAIRLNGQPHAVTLQADGFTLRSGQPLPLGDHLLEIETSLRDRAGRPLEQRFDAAFTWDGTTPALGIFKAESDTTPTNLLRRSRADKDLIADLTGLNLGFQGQPYDPETGLYYFRNRYYDPELGRFITADPLGYVDGPSLYAAFGNDPVNGRDPLGLAEMGGDIAKDLARQRREQASREAEAKRQAAAAAEGRRLAKGIDGVLATLPETASEQEWREAVHAYLVLQKGMEAGSNLMWDLFGPPGLCETYSCQVFRQTDRLLGDTGPRMELAFQVCTVGKTGNTLDRVHG